MINSKFYCKYENEFNSVRNKSIAKMMPLCPDNIIRDSRGNNICWLIKEGEVMEIERKFLVESLPNLDRCVKEEILQGYIAKNPEVRIRQKGSFYFLSIKSNGDLNRKEFETLITLSHFETLWYNFIEEYISKTRYYIELNQHNKAELDIYHDELEGLVTVEVEFNSEEEANSFTPPDWFGKEVTYDKRYKNKNLAIEWSTI